MENKDKNERTEKAKEAFANIWQKTSSAGKNVGKKAAEGVKAFADQTKKIYMMHRLKNILLLLKAKLQAKSL